jgi:hypothetical protein
MFSTSDGEKATPPTHAGDLIGPALVRNAELNQTATHPQTPARDTHITTNRSSFS